MPGAAAKAIGFRNAAFCAFLAVDRAAGLQCGSLLATRDTEHHHEHPKIGEASERDRRHAELRDSKQKQEEAHRARESQNRSKRRHVSDWGHIGAHVSMFRNCQIWTPKVTLIFIFDG